MAMSMSVSPSMDCNCHGYGDSDVDDVDTDGDGKLGDSNDMEMVNGLRLRLRMSSSMSISNKGMARISSISFSSTCTASSRFSQIATPKGKSLLCHGKLWQFLILTLAKTTRTWSGSSTGPARTSCTNLQRLLAQGALHCGSLATHTIDEPQCCYPE